MKPPAAKESIGGKIRCFLFAAGRFQSALLLTLIYLLLWVPSGVLTILAADWLRWRPGGASAWTPRQARLNEASHLKEMF